MVFFKKKTNSDDILRKLKDLIVLLDTRVTSLEIQVEGILLRLRKKVYTEPEKDKKKVEDEKPKSNYKDMFLLGDD